MFAMLQSTYAVFGSVFGLLRGSFGLLASIALLSASLSTAALASPQCEALFDPHKTPSTKNSVFTFDKRDSLDRKLFAEELNDYRRFFSVKGLASGARIPRTPEAKLAFLEALSESRGYGLHLFHEGLKSSTPEQAAFIRKTLLGFNFEKGVRPSQISGAFAQLYLLNHSDPRSWLGLATQVFSGQGLSGKRAQIIQQRAELDLGSHALYEALDRLGFLRDPGLRDRALAWIRSHPMIVEAPVKAALDFLPLPIAISTKPADLLAARPLTPELRDRLQKEGFEALKPELEAYYGKLPHWDLRWHYATKIVSYAIMGYIAAQLAPAMLNNALPEDLRNPDASYLQLVSDIAKYWTGVARAHILGDAQVDPDSPEGKELKSLKDALVDDGDIYDVNPEKAQ